MSDYASWRPRHRAMCPEPGPEDLFLVVLIDGRQASIQPATDHAQWRGAAARLAADQQCQVKVLPMTGSELMNYLGLKPAAAQSMDTLDPAFREQAVRNCMDVLRECCRLEDREQALDLLGHLGVLQ